MAAGSTNGSGARPVKVTLGRSNVASPVPTTWNPKPGGPSADTTSVQNTTSFVPRATPALCQHARPKMAGTRSSRASPVPPISGTKHRPCCTTVLLCTNVGPAAGSTAGGPSNVSDMSHAVRASGSRTGT